MILEEYMNQEKLLLKKFNRLNYLKGVLVSRSEEDREAIIEEIKDIIDDIELIINDSNESENNEEVTGYRSGKEFTLEELEGFDGKNGNSAYVAVDGTIYDVTESSFWRSGNHFGVQAGKDLTEQFYSCHSNNLESMRGIKVVGILK
ncbi:MAG: hypothetical protein KH200_05405 [Clostridium sp.]|jgi:predicted heme/steroid binding protein|nr:hypothetical protein [Clostridium sp.]